MECKYKTHAELQDAYKAGEISREEYLEMRKNFSPGKQKIENSAPPKNLTDHLKGFFGFEDERK